MERTVGFEPDLGSLEGCYLTSKKPAYVFVSHNTAYLIVNVF